MAINFRVGAKLYIQILGWIYIIVVRNLYIDSYKLTCVYFMSR